MEKLQKIKIDGKEYFIIESIQNFKAEDSFIQPKNKLAETTANGEAKKHIGSYKGSIGKQRSTFFNYDKWGIEYFELVGKQERKTFKSAKINNAVISENRCFFSKNNLQKYMKDAKTEYYQQEQHYRNDISKYYQKKVQEIDELVSDKVFFSIYDASDNLSKTQNRGYIRSDDKVWKLWRELILPGISYLSILKLVPIGNQKAEPLFYFRILLDYQFRSFIHPKSLDTEQELEKEEIKTSAVKKPTHRIGSEKYRRDVINHMPQCPFTKITDERLLIASHIKPYSVCIKNNEKDEALDYLNGLALSPTYDKLFDQGYITFTDNGELICGTQLSAYTWEKLSINPNAKNKMRIFPEKREIYLDYHRNNVFQDDINDLI
jgi:putative restriction endonuclease